MSIIFGIYKPESDARSMFQLQELADATTRFALEGTFLETAGRVGMGMQPYRTDESSRLDVKPLADSHDNLLCFDGRLDNRSELCKELAVEGGDTSTARVVLLAYDRWQQECFSKFIGDWALSLWSQNERTLYLARDHAGTRNLYYEVVDGNLTWSTSLETFLVDRPQRKIDSDYAKRFLAAEPTRDTTPFAGVRAVTPAHYLRFREGSIRLASHWSPRTRNHILYRSDQEYADHFISLFRQAVGRRTGPGAPILAELSGGMDSSSIVCISDQIRRENGAQSVDELLDTLSYHDDSEPDWNERPFFEVVEHLREKVGFHIDVSGIEDAYDPPGPFYLQPGADGEELGREYAFEALVADRGYRVILSGIGGDELLGGPTNLLPELADYLSSLRIVRLLKQGVAWSLASRSPLIHTLMRTASFTIQAYPTPTWRSKRIPPWIFDGRHSMQSILEPHDLCSSTLGLLPSAVDNCVTWWNMLETLPHRFQRALHRREYRYPYLDRDLVDFLLRVPRYRLLKPGRRRSLMRSAMQGIVPTKVLERKRKAFVTRGPMLSFSRDRAKIALLFEDSELAKLGLIDFASLKRTIEDTRSENLQEWLAPIYRAISLELWLRSAKHVA